MEGQDISESRRFSEADLSGNNTNYLNYASNDGDMHFEGTTPSEADIFTANNEIPHTSHISLERFPDGSTPNFAQSDIQNLMNDPIVNQIINEKDNEIKQKDEEIKRKDEEIQEYRTLYLEERKSHEKYAHDMLLELSKVFKINTAGDNIQCRADQDIRDCCSRCRTIKNAILAHKAVTSQFSNTMQHVNLLNALKDANFTLDATIIENNGTHQSIMIAELPVEPSEMSNFDSNISAQMPTSPIRPHTEAETQHQLTTTFLEEYEDNNVYASTSNYMPHTTSNGEDNEQSTHDENQQIFYGNQGYLEDGLNEHTNSVVLNSPEGTFLCEVCEHEFSPLDGLQDHLRNEHTVNGELGLFRHGHDILNSVSSNRRCICGMGFGHISELRKHIRESSFGKEYVCLYCDGQFAYLRDLANHVKTKHNAKEAQSNTNDNNAGTDTMNID